MNLELQERRSTRFAQRSSRPQNWIEIPWHPAITVRAPPLSLCGGWHRGVNPSKQCWALSAPTKVSRTYFVQVLSPMLSLEGRWHPPVLLKASTGSTFTTPRLCYLPASAAFSCFSYVSNLPNTHVGVPKLKIAARKKMLCSRKADLRLNYSSPCILLIPGWWYWGCTGAAWLGDWRCQGGTTTLQVSVPLVPCQKAEFLISQLICFFILIPTATWKHLKTPDPPLYATSLRLSHKNWTNAAWLSQAQTTELV